MSINHPAGREVLRTVLSVGKESFAAQGIDLPEPVVDGGGPSSTFTAAVFAGELLGLPTWGAHVAVRIPDAIYDLCRPGLIGPHLGVFCQVFFSLPESLLGGHDPETLTRTLMDDINSKLLGAGEQLLFRAYQWNANSTRMTGVAKEVNLASGMLRGMEIAQLNYIEQVGGVKLEEPNYLIVIGVDRLTYCLALRDYYQEGKALTSVADFYRMTPEHAQALERLHHNILYAEQVQPGLRERFDEELARIKGDLADGNPVDEETMKRFRTINILLETLFMCRQISGGLRQGYIGQIGDVAKLLGKAMLAHPEESRVLATEGRINDYDEVVQKTERLRLQSAQAAGDYVDKTAQAAVSIETLPERVKIWHADSVAAGINQDLLDGMPADELSALSEWVAASGDDIGSRVRDNSGDLPLGFAAVKESEERPLLSVDLAMTPTEALKRMDTIAFVGVDGRGRRERHEKLFSLLESAGINVPSVVGQILPYLGIENLFCSARVFERSVVVLVEAWFERHLPELLDTYRELSRNTPPAEQAMQYCWAALKVELVARYLLLRAAANKPLWQDPYGARHLINRKLLPLWQESPPPESLRRRLIETAVQDIDVPQIAVNTVKDYLLGKLLDPKPME